MPAKCGACVGRLLIFMARPHREVVPALGAGAPRLDGSAGSPTGVDGAAPSSTSMDGPSACGEPTGV
eukprot:12271409-Alexandrium_andersonii.AAC.1